MNNATDKLAQNIIDEAKRYKQSCRGRVSYHTYEQFKARLYELGCYGYERDLADALGV